jgi:DNA-binding CsgD family transcriptional regulator
MLEWNKLAFALRLHNILPRGWRALHGTESAVHVYVVATNYLAAQYIRALLLSCQPAIDLHVIRDQELSCSAPAEPSSALVIVDPSSLSSATLSHVGKLRICFPNSRFIIVGNHDFGHRFQRAFPEWVVSTLEYANMNQLPCLVLEAAGKLDGSQQTGCATPLAPATRLSLCARLSKRESEIFELVRLQLSNKEIANRLNIAEATVKFHVSNAFAKMGLRRRRELFHALSG